MCGQVSIIITAGPIIKGIGFYTRNENGFFNLTIIIIDFRYEARSATSKYRRTFCLIFKYALKGFDAELNRVSGIVTKNNSVNSKLFRLIGNIFYRCTTITEISFNICDSIELHVGSEGQRGKSQSKPKYQ